jgi:hypothetical protein
VRETQTKKILLVALNRIEDGPRLGAGRSQVPILSPRLKMACKSTTSVWT